MLAKKNKGWINQSCIRKTSEGLCCHPSFDSGSCALILFLFICNSFLEGGGGAKANMFYICFIRSL